MLERDARPASKPSKRLRLDLSVEAFRLPKSPIAPKPLKARVVEAFGQETEAADRLKALAKDEVKPKERGGGGASRVESAEAPFFAQPQRVLQGLDIIVDVHQLESAGPWPQII